MTGAEADLPGQASIPSTPGPGDIAPFLRERWSPRGFDAQHELTESEVRTLLEAARWAPSAGNSQPWAFHPARRGTAGHADLVDALQPSAAAWAPSAALLVVNLAHTLVEGTDWPYSEFSHYDLGQAVAHLSIQAQTMGLASRQFRAFDLAKVASRLRVPEHWSVLTMIAIGRPDPALRRGPRASQRVDSITWPRERPAAGPGALGPIGPLRGGRPS